MPETVVSREEFQAFIQKILPRINELTPNQQHNLYLKLAQIRELDKLQDARDHLLPFMTLMWPAFVVSWHHHVIANTLEELDRGELLRAAISTPPRYTKSEMLSVYYPAWVLGRNPTDTCKIIQAGNTQKLSQRFGRKAKAVLQDEKYATLFPNAKLSVDSKAAGSFTLTEGGEYYAVGVGGALAGRGASHLLIDDPYSEQDVVGGESADLFENVDEWWLTVRQRLQPGGRVCILHTRWSKMDLIGRLTERMAKNPKADKFRVISIPALDEKDESTFPSYWKTEEVKQTRLTMMERAPHLWFAQYMQAPTSAEMAIIKREWWKKWEKRNVAGDFVTPPCKFTMMMFDTAYTAKKRSNPTACTIWGIFDLEDGEEGDGDTQRIILLHSFEKKMELPELLVEAKKLVKEWEPDLIQVEEMSSGPWLLHEFRKIGIFANGIKPKPGEDKMSRLNSVAPIFSSGRVYYIPTAENEATVQQCADFPGGSGDDLVDTTSYALRQFRRGGFVTTNQDLKDDPRDAEMIVDRNYY